MALNRRDFVAKALAVTGVCALPGCQLEDIVVTSPPGPYDYRYYYYDNVYYHPYSGSYYYVWGNRWQRTRTPPPGVIRNRSNYRVLVIRDRVPYAHNDDHWHRYGRRPSQSGYRRPHDRAHDPWHERDPWHDRRRPARSSVKPAQQTARPPRNKRIGEDWRDYHERKGREAQAQRNQTSGSGGTSPPPSNSNPRDTSDKLPWESWSDYHERKNSQN
jgi:hypothetical protein